MKETLAGLAAKTGFSITTISRVLSGKADLHRISPETREKILTAARENNYFPNLVAQNLRTNRTNTIGLMLPSVANPYFADIASSVIEEARHRNYTTIVLDSAESPELEKDGISSLMSRQVDGIIAVPCGDDPSLFEEINRKFIPVILIDRYFSNSMLPYITTNNYLGGIDAVNLFDNERAFQHSMHPGSGQFPAEQEASGRILGCIGQGRHQRQGSGSGQ